MNFFQWLRDGVRKSVLMGVSDAVEQIGLPDNAPDSQPTLAALLSNDSGSSSTSTATRTRKKATTTAASRKRLGKSLKDMNSTS
ncbi:hypothetical protein [Roseiconus lacunae]|uniref:Uncharacterized protein n=1 Tax=Roseiconus lacunae TaxID=2605694 RepID=A0ABT7PKT0_9BACT|nr:hypothetical protein [Roseiconus lacunae]MCD0460758.1 hypothetical protein [Roseiconus lacunae]MDM4017112.1 hypothetical protein [Roseiconus lacunae]WRQ51308.1 hypothetical protein U8335_01945 [Stieleria sp. HD01]